MGRPLRVALVQLRSGIDPAANRAHALPFLREAAASGARLIATPECTTRLDRNRDRLLSALLEEEIDPDVKAWRAIAAELGVWLLLGSTTVKAPDGRGHNRSLLFAPDGKIAARYDKIHLFDVQLGSKAETYRESATFAPGGTAVLAEGPMGAKLGLTICYDVRFPALYRALALAGAEIISVPAAFTRPTGEAHWETLLRARAIETNAFVIAPAQGGVHEDGRGTWGRSMIVDPWGEVVAILDHDEPGLVAADLDLDLVEEARAKIPAWRGGPAFEGP
ncbi:MAG: carbon-nitrogen hydrolase family protein [Hydrogenophilaceae bacterium]|jgi:predicted amidohydrolase|nr:carbon-nitrogen hydrolase family protein [Hydrogenophilaceae bacterium]